MDPLIITATANVSGVFPDSLAPDTLEDKIKEAELCISAGASIIHLHSDPVKYPWKELIPRLRRGTNAVIQSGQARGTIETRLKVLSERPDMISINLSNHDIHYESDGREVYQMHPRNELLDMISGCHKYSIKPELELWNTGHLWNLKFLIQKNDEIKWLANPLWVSLVTGFAGGAWSPPTLENYLYIRRMLPVGTMLNVVVKSRDREEHLRLIAAAIANGDNIRVGAEDNPYLADGKMKETHEIVKWAADLSRHMGRRVATVDETKEMLNMI